MDTTFKMLQSTEFGSGLVLPFFINWYVFNKCCMTGASKSYIWASVLYFIECVRLALSFTKTFRFALVLPSLSSVAYTNEHVWELSILYLSHVTGSISFVSFSPSTRFFFSVWAHFCAVLSSLSNTFIWIHDVINDGFPFVFSAVRGGLSCTPIADLCLPLTRILYGELF